MGGFGSGRKFGAGCTDDYWSIDVRRLQRDGLFVNGGKFRWQWIRNSETVASINIQVKDNQVILQYRIQKDGSDWQDMDYPVSLTTTTCTYGGERYWFNCPSCGKRVAILYSYHALFTCRHCCNLGYRCQRETETNKAARRTNNIRSRLGWELGVLNPPGIKPKGMRWKTFKRLQSEHDKHAEQVFKSLLETYKRYGFEVVK